MYEPTWIDTYFKILMIAAWLPAIVFPLVYGFTAPWWQSFIGRALLTKAVGMGFLITVTNLFYIFGYNYTSRDTLRFIGTTLLAFGLWFQATSLVLAKIQQWRDRRNPTIREEDVRHDV